MGDFYGGHTHCQSRTACSVVLDAHNSEIESAKSFADVKTSQYVTGAKLQTNFEVLDSNKASGHQKIIHGDYKRKVFICGEAARKQKRFLTERQVAWMICEYFKVSDTDASVLGLNEILKVEWKNDSVQSFETRWGETIIAMRINPTRTFWSIHITVSFNSQNSQSHCCVCAFKILFKRVNRETTRDVKKKKRGPTPGTANY